MTNSPGVLSAAERRTIECVTSRILPSDPLGPGARDANVVGYVDWIIAQPSFTADWECLCTGTALLDNIASALTSHRFADCNETEQDEVLSRLELVPHPTAQRYLRLIVRLTMAGFFGHPKYGGNRQEVAWKWIGFTPDPEPPGPKAT
ncbi:MAG: gluconate 2-dehydrogenase subunit 3 family protein [Cyanobacteria bacterium]|nr:gluconate 2-dehydrogenase subunit 3 family protein [Cyanobacteriota bacterium]